MVSTFNKRELLEFPNWSINQWRFPDETYILIRSTEFSKLQLKRVLNFLEVEEFKTETGESVPKFSAEFDPSNYDLIISPKQKTFITQIVFGTGNKWPTVSLTPEEFKRMSICYSIDFFDEDQLNYWLKHEKHIEFIPYLAEIKV